MVSWVFNGRVMFLIWFVIVAIIIAAVLIFIEVRLKKKEEEFEKKKVHTPVDKISYFMRRKKSLREKLDFISETAKNYFNTEYGILPSLSYSELVREFQKRGNGLEADFCQEVFDIYYLSGNLNEKKVHDLAKSFRGIFSKKESEKRVSASPSLLDKVEGGIRDKTNLISSKVEGYVEAKKEKMERNERIIARVDNEVVRWVKDAIRRGYSKIDIRNLLLEDGKKKGDVDKVLRVYDKEALEKNRNPAYRGGGIAERIIKNEKDRLIRMETIDLGE